MSTESGCQGGSTDRTLPFLFAWHLQQAGLEVQYDVDLGVLQRRGKDDEDTF